jgi:hypothetical protein
MLTEAYFLAALSVQSCVSACCVYQCRSACLCACLPCAAELLRPLVDTLQQAAGVELKITVRNKGGEQQQVSTARRAQPGMTAQIACRAAWCVLKLVAGPLAVRACHPPQHTAAAVSGSCLPPLSSSGLRLAEPLQQPVPGARSILATALTTPFLLRNADMVRLHVLLMLFLLQLNEVLDDIRAAEAEPRVGHLPKEQPTGAIAELWTSTLQGSGLTLTDATPGVCCHGEVTCRSCMCKGVLGVVLLSTWACMLCRQ